MSPRHHRLRVGRPIPNEAADPRAAPSRSSESVGRGTCHWSVVVGPWLRLGWSALRMNMRSATMADQWAD